jgi:hypothetical protein
MGGQLSAFKKETQTWEERGLGLTGVEARAVTRD